MRIVVDTNVLVGAMMSPEHANRTILRRCLEGEDTPLLGNALFLEMREVMGREALFVDVPVSVQERTVLFEAFCASADWVHTYFLWRPNLRDEADNHLIEIAVAGDGQAIVTWNVRDLRRGELHFPNLEVLDPVEYIAATDREGG